MTQSDHEIDEVLRIARRASEVVLRVYATDFAVELKGPNDPVTRADEEANLLICKALEAAFPGDGILAEESVPTDKAEIARIASKPRCWFVDPLDGTREFTLKNGEFSVMIGLAVEGRAALGVVVVPTTGEAAVGRAGQGAFVEAKDGSRRPLEAKDARAADDLVMIASRSHSHPVIAATAERLRVTRVIPCGSIGLKVLRVALGEADIYVHAGLGAKHWDTCGPEAILAAAGGAFSDLDGAAFDYARADLVICNGIVATRAAVHRRTLDAARLAREDAK